MGRSRGSAIRSIVPVFCICLLGLVISIASVACRNRYSLRVSATADPERISVFEPGTSIAVSFDPDAHPLSRSVYQDLASSIERQLQELGFAVADERDAEIVVLFAIPSDAFSVILTPLRATMPRCPTCCASPTARAGAALAVTNSRSTANLGQV